MSHTTVPHILLCLIYYCVSHIIPCLSYTTLSHRILSLIQYFVSYNTVPHILLCLSHACVRVQADGSLRGCLQSFLRIFPDVTAPIHSAASRAVQFRDGEWDEESKLKARDQFLITAKSFIMCYHEVCRSMHYLPLHCLSQHYTPFVVSH